jgi:hypothetical protein
MKDFPINHDEEGEETNGHLKIRDLEDEKKVNRNIDEQTSGHLKVRDLEDEKKVNRNIDEQTSGHLKVRDLEDEKRVEDAQTEGHTLRRRRELDDADESTEGHKR